MAIKTYQKYNVDTTQITRRPAGTMDFYNIGSNRDHFFGEQRFSNGTFTLSDRNSVYFMEKPMYTSYTSPKTTKSSDIAVYEGTNWRAAGRDYGLPTGDYHRWDMTLLIGGVKTNLVETFQAEEGTYPEDMIHTDGYWYVLLPNQMPIISGNDEDKGGVNSPFSYNFTVDDLDSTQTLSIKIKKSWSSEVQSIGNARRKQTYTVDVTSEEFNKLTLDVQQEIHIEVTDGAGAIANRYITFRRTNAAPTITISNKNLGNVGHEGITFDYSISDLENDIVKLEFMFGGQVLETVEDVVLNETHNFTIKKKDYVKIPNGEQVITLRATDSKGANNFDVVRFVKEVHGCGFILSQEVDTIVDYAFFNAKIDIADEEVFKLEFCNNFNDDEPIWEEGTLGKIHNFTNKSHNNAPKVAVRSQVLEEPNTGESFISSPAVLKWGWN